MSLAIVEDCGKCKEMRAKVQAQKEKEAQEEEQRKQRMIAQKAAAEANRRNEALIAENEAERERKRAEARRRSRTPPLPSSSDDEAPRRLPFNPADAKWDKRRGRGICHDCGDGYVEGEPETENIYTCEVCRNVYHWKCTQWIKLVG
jgi:hypothetical protein